jgi:LysM repeat protein
MPTSAAVPVAQLDDCCLLVILQHLDPQNLVQLRLVSTRLRSLADVALEEGFMARWRVSGIVVPPPVAPGYAAAWPGAFAQLHRLQSKESLAAVAVRYQSDVVALKRWNNLLSDSALASRQHLFVPVSNPETAAAGRRVAFMQCEHSRRRFVVVLQDGDLADPADEAGSADRRARSRQFVVAKLAAVLQRALRTDADTAAFYLDQNNCDLRAAMAKVREVPAGRGSLVARIISIGPPHSNVTCTRQANVTCTRQAN